MKPRSVSVIFLLAVLILSSLACNLSTQLITRKLEFVSVAVLPVESDGSALIVDVNYKAVGAEDQVAVTCYYQSSSGTIPIDPPTTAGGYADVRDLEMVFPFSVTQPGVYQAYCTSSDGAQSSTASFRVIEAGVLITQPQEQPSNPGAPEKFTTARLEIIPGSSPIHATVRVFWGCQPPSGGYLVVLPDGSLEGICHETETGEGYVWVKDGALTGKYEPNATIPNINFSLLTNTKMDGKTSQGELRQYVTDETFIGGGSLESIDPATGAALFTGTATFTFKCEILVGTPICPNVDGSGGMSTSFSGKVTFKMTFFP